MTHQNNRQITDCMNDIRSLLIKNALQLWTELHEIYKFTDVL